MTADNISFMREACLMCDLSNCEVKTGAIAVFENIIISKGHNQLPQSSSRLAGNKCDNKCNTECSNERDIAVHAEINLLNNAKTTGVSLAGCDLYLTRFPCEKCAEEVIKAGVKRIFYMSDLFTLGNRALSYLQKNNIEVVQIKEKEVWR